MKNRIFPVIGISVLLNGCLVPDSENASATAVAEPQVSSLSQLVTGYPIGVAVAAGDASNSILGNNEAQDILKEHFNQITAENIMKPMYLQPSNGSFDYTDADALIAFADTNSLSVHGHTLVWHRQLPAWMASCSGATECETFLKSHITNVATYFKDKVVSWDVVNEAYNEDGSLRTTDSVWGKEIGESAGSGYITTAFTEARAADSSAELYYNDYNLEQNGGKLDSVLTKAAELKSSNLIDGIGFQMHITSESPDVATLKTALQRAVDTGLKVKITELDIRMNSTGSLSNFTSQIANEQKERYEDVINAYLDTVPAAQRGGITIWGISDADSWIPGEFGHADWPLLFDSVLRAKPALEGVANALEAHAATSLFNDTFTEGTYWYRAWGSHDGTLFSHNATDGVMQVQIPWGGQGENYVMAISFDNYDVSPIDITEGINLSFRIKVTSALAQDGKLAVQPLIGDSSQSAMTSYQFGYTADEWATITIENINPDFAFGYDGGVDFTNVDRVGLEFISNGDLAGNNDIIYIDDVKITAAN